MITPGWKTLDPDLDAFMTEFERRGDDPGSDDGGLFADRFLVTDPGQSMVLPREALLASLPYRRRMFEEAGVGSARLVSAAQLDLDPWHVLVRSDWDAGRGDEPAVRLESTFLIRRDGPRILAYLNHKDIAAVLAAL